MLTQPPWEVFLNRFFHPEPLTILSTQTHLDLKLRLLRKARTRQSFPNGAQLNDPTAQTQLFCSQMCSLKQNRVSSCSKDLPRIFYQVVCLESDCNYSSNVISEEKWEKKAWTPDSRGCLGCFLTRAVQNKAGAHSLGAVHYKTRLAPAWRRSGSRFELRDAIALCRQLGYGVLTAERLSSVPRQTTRSGDLQKLKDLPSDTDFWGLLLDFVMSFLTVVT